MYTVEWRAWSNDTLIEKLPEIVNVIDLNLNIFSEENGVKNQAAIESFKFQPLTLRELETDNRNKDLIALGFAVNAIARHQQQTTSLNSTLGLLQFSHELFRAGNQKSQPSKLMYQSVNDAIKVILADGIKRIELGEGDAGVLHEDIEKFIESAWGTIPTQVSLSANESLLQELERIRVSHEDDIAFHREFVRNNVEGVLTLEVPTRLEKIIDKWVQIGEHVAPATVRDAKRNFRRPQKLSELLTKQIVIDLEESVERGDVEGIGNILSGVEEVLESNLRLRLNVKTEYREPVSEIKYQGGPDLFFQEARQLLAQGNSIALQKFKNIYFHKTDNFIAREWYAYALTVFGHSMDIHEIIELLEEAVHSDRFRVEYGWVACWNLACALQRLPARSKEALDVLLPVLDDDYHVSDVFELCLLWALEQDREDILEKLLLRSPYFEAHLLMALHDARKDELPQNKQERFHENFRRINRILRDLDRVFPDPAERLSEGSLDQLTQGFIENSLSEAGIEWFRQRLSSSLERFYYKNWECAARLNEDMRDMNATWRCRERQWHCTQNNKKLPNNQKKKSLTFILNWAEKNGFKENGLRVLRESWRKADFTEADLRLWERRLQITSVSANDHKQPPFPLPESNRANIAQFTEFQRANNDVSVQQSAISISEAESVIQEVAGAFKGVVTADALAIKSSDAEKLLDAVKVKHNVPVDAIAAIREVIRLSNIFHRGVDEQQSQDLVINLRNQIDIVRQYRKSIPFELVGLAETCERVLQSLSIRLKAIPDPSITPPADLKIIFDEPAQNDKYLTRVCVRLANLASEEMSNISVAFTSPSQHLRFLGDHIPLSKLSSQEKYIFECPLEVSGGIEKDVEIRVFVNFQIGSVKRSVQTSGLVPVRFVGETIPFAERFNTTKPVSAERKDLFHGRHKELKDLLAAFSGGQLRKLYFVNGIRRVGKSSLLLHLASQSQQNLALILNVEELQLGTKMSSIHFVRQLMRECIKQVKKIPNLSSTEISLPGPEVFELDPPWVVFDDFLNEIRHQTQRKTILLCFDEVQRLVMRIADPDDPMDESFLSWLRGKIQGGTDTLIVCTGSEPYDIMRRRYEHNLWGNMEPYNVSFVDEEAMKKIVTLPIAQDGVAWLPEALDRLWDMTEGHPWVTQMVAEKICDRLNQDRRRVVMPSDVDTAVEIIVTSDERPADLWWNERNGLITANHRQVAFLILQNQEESRTGVLETELGMVCQRAGLRSVGKLLDEMRVLEVLTGKLEGSDTRWRIRGAFLEKHLAILAQRSKQEHGSIQPANSDLPLALMLDWENVKISLSNHLKQLPVDQQKKLEVRLDAVDLASRLHNLASRYGVPRQRWAVANWDNGFFRGDQADFRKQVRYETDMSGQSKADASDHVLRERIHEVLREHPEIATFVIATGDADFAEAIRTLQIQGKRVVLWSTRDNINNDAYKFLLSGPDAITVEWLEDMIFEANP